MSKSQAVSSEPLQGELPPKAKIRFTWPQEMSNRALRQGDVYRALDGTYHFIEYVNHSGAYAVPLTGVNREVKGHIINVTSGGKMISVNSAVEIINPLAMGGASAEYRRYARMVASARGEGADMSDILNPDAPGVQLGQFDDSALTQVLAEADAADTATEMSESDIEGMKMAKKANGKANGKARARSKATATVRKCACGCGGETSGYFVPGHDARMHGWIAKLADGRIDGKGRLIKSGEPTEQVVPNAVLKALDLVSTKEGHRAKAPHFWQE